jgi:beta-1,4-mannosyltransferase
MSPTRIAVFPEPGGTNPYSRLLHAALARQGVELVDGAQLDARWVRGAGGELDAIHLHWIEFLYAADGPRPLRDALAHKRAAGLVQALRAARRRPVRVVWTVHNLRPHEARHPWLDRLTGQTAAACCDALIVHSAHAAARVAEHFAPAAPVTVLPHPNYLGAYPPSPVGRERVRDQLGVPRDAFVYLVFGQVRRYKRVPEVVRAFRATAGADARLVVAGAVVEDALAGEIAAARDGDERVVLRLAAVPDDEVAGLHAAADAAVLHYRDVFSSGALLLALSFGLPVAGPRDTTLTELCRPAAVVPYAPGGLEQALVDLREGDQRLRGAAALASAKAYNWDDYAAGVAALYRGTAPADLRRAA